MSNNFIINRKLRNDKNGVMTSEESSFSLAKKIINTFSINKREIYEQQSRETSKARLTYKYNDDDYKNQGFTEEQSDVLYKSATSWD